MICAHDTPIATCSKLIYLRHFVSTNATLRTASVVNPKTLHHFLHLADTPHFGKASTAAKVSISTLSRSIRQLENELDITLFNRDNRSVSITKNGLIFEQYARDALLRHNALRQSLIRRDSPLTGELSLYCSVTASYSVLFKLLQQFRPHFPQVEIKLQTGDPDEAINRILTAKEDLTIAARPATLPRGVRYLPLASSELLFIAPVEHSDTDIPGTGVKNPDTWAHVPMIIPNSGLVRQRIDNWFKELKISPRIYAQVAGNEAIVSMVSLGLGVGVVPEIVLENSPLAYRVRVLDASPGLQAIDLGLFALNKALRNPLVSAFWKTSDRATTTP